MQKALLAILLTSTALAGCLNGTPDDDLGPTAVVDGDVVIDVPIHVVLVGPHPDLDRDALFDGLPTQSAGYMTSFSGMTGLETFAPYRNVATWTLHEAPQEFTDSVFAAMEELSFDAEPTSWLARYDRDGPQRLCDDCSVDEEGTPTEDPRSIKRFPAVEMEHRLEALRNEHGLVFEDHATTVFLLDHHTNGDLDTTTYWQTEYKDGTEISITKTMRAWGGTHDFVWLDRSGAPAGFDYRPWGIAGYDDPLELNGRIDAPIWDLAEDPTNATSNVRENLRDFYHMKAAREPLYSPHAVDALHINAMFVIEEGTTVNENHPLNTFTENGGVEMFDPDRILQSFADLAPWVKWSIDINPIHLPDDDPELAAAIQESKARNGGVMQLGDLQSYFRENFDKYGPRIEGGRTYPMAFFIMDAVNGGPVVGNGGGIALDNARGASMVAYNFFSDVKTCATNAALDAVFGLDPTSTADCASRQDGAITSFDEQSANAEDFYTNYIVHELGHEIMLRHPHDRDGDEHGDHGGPVGYRLNWLWDSTLTAMTYRHWGDQFDAFDQRYYAIHTAAMRLAANPDHPAATEVERLLEEGRFVEAATKATEMPVAYDLHDRPAIPTPFASETGAFGARGDELAFPLLLDESSPAPEETPEGFDFVVPEGTTWARVMITGEDGPISFAYVIEPDDNVIGFGYGADGHEAHLLELIEGETYTVAAIGAGGAAVTVEFFDTDPLEQAS